MTPYGLTRLFNLCNLEPMRNRWSDRDAAQFKKKYAAVGEDLALRTYSARLIGQEPKLVLHGGGNTSVKTVMKDVTGRDTPVLCVKGSGWDLGAIEPAGHPAVRFEELKRLRRLLKLSDEDMVNALRANMLDSSGPNPSVETLLHAFLPHKFIDHSHADAVLALIDQPRPEKFVRAWAGDKLGIVPYIMPGFDLSKAASAVYEKNPAVEGLVLLKHGLFTFGATAKESYDRMIYWVDRVEKRHETKKRLTFHAALSPRAPVIAPHHAAQILRGVVKEQRSAPAQEDPVKRIIVRRRANPAILKFVSSREVSRLSQTGPATPDHVIRTKPWPLLIPARAVGNEANFKRAAETAFASFVKKYKTYFDAQCRAKKTQKKALDPLPRVALVPGAGLFALAETAKDADIALDIYEATIGIIERAWRWSRYEVLSPGDLFDMEYWSLEQAKLGKAKEKPLGRKVVWISGAARGIGRATAAAFAAAGAHVYLADLNERDAAAAHAELKLKSQGAFGSCDVTQKKQVEASFRDCAENFGGVDIVVSNAGVAPTGSMASLPDEILRKSFEINFFAHQHVAQSAMDVFLRQGLGGVLLFNASKSAFNPGPGFGPYSLPKAGVVALMRQYAVEGGSAGVRSNAVNADRVNTNLYGEGLLAARARARGLSVPDYLSGNLVKEEVFAEDVAQAFVYLALARKTTGAVIPVDGGNAAAFPR
jgi:rhamnose utilization protein RhaD (predicted bifunctional aldolase and dehydrogenase)/NAD(P)-dependent dehydrogenase (short-subunit alcohol dehydrogenase family)